MCQPHHEVIPTTIPGLMSVFPVAQCTKLYFNIIQHISSYNSKDFHIYSFPLNNLNGDISIE